MSSPFRRKQVRRAILETLDMAKGYALESLTLQSFVDDQLRPPMGGDEWREAINEFLLGEFVRFVPSPLDPLMKQYVLTERGKSALQSI